MHGAGECCGCTRMIVYNQDALSTYMRRAVAVSNDSPVLLDHFLAPRTAREASEPLFDELLEEGALDPEVRRKGLAATHRLVPNESPVRDLTRLSEYCEAARWRGRVREEFGLPPCPTATVAEVTQHFENSALVLK